MEEQMNAQPLDESSSPDDVIEQAENITPETKGENVQFSSGFAFGITAGSDAKVEEAGALGIAAGRDMQLSYGGALSIAVGNNLTLTNGGAMIMPVGNTTEITNGGTLFMLGNQVTAHKSLFGVVLAQQSNLGEGSKVLLDTKQALIFGVSLGIVLAVSNWLLKRK